MADEAAGIPTTQTQNASIAKAVSRGVGIVGANSFLRKQHIGFDMRTLYKIGMYSVGFYAFEMTLQGPITTALNTSLPT